MADALTLRVALWAPLPPPMGGVGRWTQRYLAAAARHELTVTLLNIAPPVGGFSEKSTFRLDRLKPALAGIRQLAGLLARREVDVVHVTTTLFWATAREAVVLSMCKIAGVPTVLHVHSGNQIIAWRDGLAHPKRAALDGVLRAADRVVVLSSDLETYLRREVPHLDVVRIGNPVELDQPPPGALVLPPRRTPIRVLFVGAVTPKKGVTELAQAVATLTNVELAVIGEEGEALDVEEGQRMRAALAALEAQGRLVRAGEKTSEEVLRAYREADVFCLPSHREGLPNVLLEAMAAGCACVATPVGGIPDLLEGAGVLVPVGAVDALAERIQALAADATARTSWGQLARERVASAYGADVVMAQYRDAYATLVRCKK